METINYQNFRIDAENICVDYNGKVALYDANLRLKPGQICGFCLLYTSDAADE